GPPGWPPRPAWTYARFTEDRTVPTGTPTRCGTQADGWMSAAPAREPAMARHEGSGRRGSVRQSANGTWFFVVDVTQAGGERRQTRRRGFATRRDAQRELTRVLT